MEIESCAYIVYIDMSRTIKANKGEHSWTVEQSNKKKI